ncbi:MAG: SDR family NAD(P)-dependent oxidoreductase [Chloroflexota bacterium]
MKLEGRVALVTGGSRGIGRATVLALAREGAAVAINFLSQAAAAEQLAAEITREGGRALAFQADVASAEQAQALVGRTIAELGGLHVLVNNAGVARDALIYELQPEAWQQVMRVNFGGVVNCTCAVMEHMMSRQEGVIVNVSSVMAERAWVGNACYSASKAAVNAFTRSAALELARFGVRVNGVLAGFVPTDMSAPLLQRDGGRGIVRHIPLRTFATPEDVARAIVFLADPASAHVTGSMVTVDGGSSAVLGVGRPL